MRPDSIRPMQDPDAPNLPCADCRCGRNECHECGGVGYFETRDWARVIREGCELCGGKGELECETCDGAGEYEDPEALLECPTCFVWLNADTGECLDGCGYVHPSKKEVAA